MHNLDSNRTDDLTTNNSIKDALINLRQNPLEEASFSSRATRIFSAVEKLPFSDAMHSLIAFYSENAVERLRLSGMAMNALDVSLTKKQSDGSVINEAEKSLINELFEGVAISFDEAKNSENGQMGSSVESGFLKLLNHHPEIVDLAYLPLSNTLANLEKNNSEIYSFDTRVKNIFSAIKLLPSQDAVDAVSLFYSMNSKHSLELTSEAISTLKFVLARKDDEPVVLSKLFNSMAHRYSLARESNAYNYPGGIQKILELLEENPDLYQVSGSLISEILASHKKFALDPDSVFNKKSSEIFHAVEQLSLTDGLSAISHFLATNKDHNLDLLGQAIDSVKILTTSLAAKDIALNPQEDISLRSLIATLTTMSSDQLPIEKLNLIRSTVVELSLDLPVRPDFVTPAQNLDRAEQPLPTILDFLLNEFNLAKDVRSKLLLSLNQAGLDVDEQRTLYKLISPNSSIESKDVDNEESFRVVEKMPSESLNELASILIGRGPTLQLAMLLAMTPKDKLSKEVLEQLDFSDDQSPIEGSLSIGHKYWYLCGNAEPRMNTSIKEGGYVVIKSKNSPSKAGVVVKMYGKITGLVTSTIQIGDRLVPKGVYISPVGDTKTLIQSAFEGGANLIEITDENLQFALIRELDDKRQPELLDEATGVVQNTPTPKINIAGLTRSEYLKARFEWE